MKKYVKPALFFERYELSQHVAACDWDLNNLTEELCGFSPDPGSEYSEDYILLLDGNVCNFDGPYCYQSAEGGLNTFNS